MAAKGNPADVRVAVKSMCTMLVAKPNFNYTLDLLQALVPRLAHPDARVGWECHTTLVELFKADMGGQPTLEVGRGRVGGWGVVFVAWGVSCRVCMRSRGSGGCVGFMVVW